MAEGLSVLVVPSDDGPVGIALGEGAAVAALPPDCVVPRLLEVARIPLSSGTLDAVLITVATAEGRRSFRLPRPLSLLRRKVDALLPLPPFLRSAMTCRGAAGVLFLDDGSPALMVDAFVLGGGEGEP